MEAKAKRSAHILAVPYPTQGHVNPLLQFCKRLSYKGAKTTLAITKFISKSTTPKSGSVSIETISDGFDEGGFTEAESVADYLIQLEAAGSRTLEELVESYKESDHPVDCIVYDAFFPWALEVAKRCGIKGACFFTQACAVNYVYYLVHHGKLKVPVTSTPVDIPGMPPLDLPDMPSFIYVHGSYPAYFEMVLKQFLNLEKADFVLVNTYYELEEKAADTMNKDCPLLTIGPTVPSFYLDKRVPDDNDYGLNLFKLEDSTDLMNWLHSKPTGSIVYIAFGSLANISSQQLEEIACALKSTNFHFLWVVRELEHLQKLSKEFSKESGTGNDKGYFVSWSPQIQVLSTGAIGCFFTHGGWNSTVEALTMGLPVVVMPNWSDQTMNAKLLQDVWQVGVRVRVDDDGIVRRGEIEGCLRKVMEGETSVVFKRNAVKYRELAKEAVSEGGTSDVNIDNFILEIENHRGVGLGK